MSAKRMFALFFMSIGIVVFLAMFLFAVPAGARTPQPVSDDNQCITCHENLYYLHDTGKAYCLDESPMACVDCHGGNPTAVIKEEAHYDRSAHPVINDDDKKCYECHPAEAETRVEQFAAVAGIKPVLVSEPCETEVYEPASFAPAKPIFGELETLTMVMAGMVGLVLVGYFLFRTR